MGKKYSIDDLVRETGDSYNLLLDFLDQMGVCHNYQISDKVLSEEDYQYVKQFFDRSSLAKPMTKANLQLIADAFFKIGFKGVPED